MFIDPFAIGLVIGSLLTSWAVMLVLTVVYVVKGWDERPRKGGGGPTKRRPERLSKSGYWRIEP